MAVNEGMFKRARDVIPGGVNSPVRAYSAVGGTPRFIASASGATVTDAAGDTYLDYVMSYGAIILGHADERIQAAVRGALARGSSYGAPTEGEVLLAEAIIEAVPSIEMVRLVSSGTEAAMTAVRLARGATGRRTIVKFDGHYHGHADALLARAGSGLATLGMATEQADDVVVLSFNDASALEALDADVAAVIVEPVAANMGVVSPAEGFLERLRAWCDARGALLIFDEVITGFRLGMGGAQGRSGVRADLTCLGKVIGGGLPIGAVGGRRDVMEHLAPLGPVYQAGTLSGNPLAVAAGLAVLDALWDDPPFERLERRAIALADALALAAREAGVPLTVNRAGSLFSPFFTPVPVTDFDAARTQDAKAHARFFHELLARGVHVAPSAFEAWFLSDAHTEAVIERTIEAIGSAMRAAARV